MLKVRTMITDGVRDQILRDLHNEWISHKALGKRYGVSPSSVRNVIRGSVDPLERLKRRFESKFSKGPTCWEWHGPVITNGLPYGHMRCIIDGAVFCLAHRIAYRLYVGVIPDSLQVLHMCDNPGCVNPDHLFLGTHLDNMRDMSLKMRGRPHGSPQVRCLVP